MQVKHLLTLVVIFMTFTLSAQNFEERPQPSLNAQPINEQFQMDDNIQSHKTIILPFSAIKEHDQPVAGLKRQINMSLDREMVAELYQQDLEFLDLEIPYFNEQVIELEMHQYDLLTDGFEIITSESNGQPIDLNIGRFYRGSVKGQPLSTVAFSVFDGELIGMISLDGENIVVQPKEGGDDYIMYNDHDVTVDLPFSCDALTHDENPNKEIPGDHPESSNCVEVYLECDHALYLNKGSSSATVNWITAVFNNMATLYSNEGITTAISQIFVWTTPDSYSTSSSITALNQFRSTRGTYNGDLAHLCALGGSGLGGVAWLDVLCSSYGYAYSNINSTYNNVPTYSWTVEVMTHEMGHNLGSNHTQWCGWSGGALDNCWTPEGSCSRGPAPTNGGTIMSYCHLTSYGINFNNGFGTQPGDKIRAEVNGATCLGSCGGGGGGGGGTCNTPTGLAISNITSSSATASWNAVSGANNYTFEYRASGGSWTVVNPTSTTYNMTGLSPTTTYETRVKANCSGGSSSYSGTVNFTTSGTSSYCTSKGRQSNREWIRRVRTGTIDRTSGDDGGYYDATNMSSNMTKGRYNLLYFQPGKTGGTRRFYWRVWLDLNQDGDFNDRGELRLSGYSTYSGLLYSYIYIPSSAKNGSTRMRVSMRYGGYPGACQTFSRGEVEDYTIDIVSAGTLESGDGEKESSAWIISPNPTNAESILQYEVEEETEGMMTIIDQFGRTVMTQNTTLFEGRNFVGIPSEELSNGHYFVKMDYKSKTKVMRLIKK